MARRGRTSLFSGMGSGGGLANPFGPSSPVDSTPSPEKETVLTLEDSDGPYMHVPPRQPVRSPIRPRSPVTLEQLSTSEIRAAIKGRPSNRFQRDFIFISSLGSGSFGTVSKVMHRIDGAFYALKEVERRKGRFNPKREIKIMSTLTHNPNIVRYFTGWENNDYVYMQLEFCSGGSLERYCDGKGKLPRNQVIDVLRDISNGLREMHGAGIVHCDIKPENILIQVTKGVHQTIRYKIGDFGLAYHYSKLAPDDLEEGDGRFQSLDVQNSGRGGKVLPSCCGTDVYAMGLSAFMAARGEFLSADIDHMGKKRSAVEESKYVRYRQGDMPSIADLVGNELDSFIRNQCCCPTHKLTAADIYEALTNGMEKYGLYV